MSSTAEDNNLSICQPEYLADWLQCSNLWIRKILFRIFQMPVPTWLTHTLALWPANSGMAIMDGWGWVVPASSGTPNSTSPLLTPRLWDKIQCCCHSLSHVHLMSKISKVSQTYVFAKFRTKIKFRESNYYIIECHVTEIYLLTSHKPIKIFSLNIFKR